MARVHRSLVLVVLTVAMACSSGGGDGASPATTTADQTGDQAGDAAGDPAGQGVDPIDGAPGVGDPYFPDLGNGGYDVEHYTIDLAWTPDGRIDAVAVVDLVPSADLDTFHLDLVGLDVAEVRVDGEPSPFGRDGRELEIDPGPVLRTGVPVQVEVAYSGVPEAVRVGTDIFGVGWQSRDFGAYVVAEPAGAATWFPANDHPTDKATFTFDVTAPAEYAVVANGVNTARTDDASTTTWVWEATDPMATYLASVTIADLVIEERTTPDGLLIRDAFPDSVADVARASSARLDEMIAVFEDWFGPYPFAVYGHVVVPETLGYALENQTLSLFGADTIGIETVVAHELAHQWFGDAVSPASWRDIWLNEGFATYAEWIWSEETGGSTAADLAARAHRFADYGVPPGDPGPEELFQATVYVRGGLALHALRVELGDDVFRVLLREWARRYDDGHASTADLQALAEELGGEPLDDLFAAWVEGAELPPFPPGSG